ncbi:5-oxoprolinase [Desulfonema ishimotonii]|uniref:5-oxoprolinase n=1 Tax=Desulfonema ishimotonii TaxID=45657 RepID=A0A401FUN5_9BACT|nr:hydantoinase/oxoprolinase family protein [Desulfonema ishimotonii]GBC60658.1 5-oxoprolinase [Desulfonema ishimotonii]
MVIIGVDTGGTFTDFIYKDENGWGVYKCLSTPLNPAEAVLRGIRHIAHNRNIRVIHGSTVATNAILEKKGALTALITNKRFEDVIEIGRQNRTELYNLTYRKNPPLVPSDLRFGLNCRVNNAGEVLQEPDTHEMKAILEQIKAAGVASVAVSFLFSFKNPAHEKQVGALLSDAGIPSSLSHEILSEFREFERTSTTIINACVSPKMDNYISHITEAIGEGRLRIMQSNGGSISAATARSESVRTILSGPAGGAVGASEIGKMAGHERLISFDMGGTSTDVALIDGALPLTLESHIDHYPVKVPMIDIHTVGAGGGSVAFIDAGGSLRVGPESAGADPGPICYGRGERITVTDANLFLGRLIPDNFLGGAMCLDREKLNRHFEKMAAEIGLTPVALAEGVLSVANTAMERAIRVISVERGFDPRNFTLFSFGGAGGMHAAFLARLLNIPNVLVPGNPGILSAIGMLMADVIRDYSRTIMRGPEERPVIDALFAPLEARGQGDLLEEGVKQADIFLEKYLDMRYQGQSHEIIVPLTENYTETFHRLHEKTYGYCNRDRGVELVNIRLRARGIPEKPDFPRGEYAGKIPPAGAFLGEQPVVFDGRKYTTAIVDRDRLKCGNVVCGPAILAEYTSTIVIPPDAAARVDAFENVMITV